MSSCIICSEEKSIYKCPKCRSIYCSVKCNNVHKLNCSNQSVTHLNNDTNSSNPELKLETKKDGKIGSIDLDILEDKKLISNISSNEYVKVVDNITDDMVDNMEKGNEDTIEDKQTDNVTNTRSINSIINVLSNIPIDSIMHDKDNGTHNNDSDNNSSKNYSDNSHQITSDQKTIQRKSNASDDSKLLSENAIRMLLNSEYLKDILKSKRLRDDIMNIDSSHDRQGKGTTIGLCNSLISAVMLLTVNS